MPPMHPRWIGSHARRRLGALLCVGLLLGACGSAATLAPAPSAPLEPTASPSVEPEPTVTPTRKPATKVPPRPTKVTFAKVDEIVDDTTTGAGYASVKITWQSPADAATDFKLWGVTRCVNESKKTNGKPCLVAGQNLKKDDLYLIETFPGAARSASLDIPIHGEVTSNALFGSSDYYALVLGAYNEKGESVLAIVTASTVCWECDY